MKDDDNRLMAYFSATLSKSHEALLKEISEKTGINIPRIVSLAVDEMLVRNIPIVKYEIPEVDWEEYTYVDQAGKILSYMQKLSTPLDLELLIILRHDIGVPDIPTLLCALAETLKHGFVVETKRKWNRFNKQDTNMIVAYKLVGDEDALKNKRHRQYLKLKKEFESKK